MRPAPQILLTSVTDKGHELQVLHTDALYAVMYERKPINLRLLLPNAPPKYRKSAFASSGHAFLLADKLNAQFNTDQFEVAKLDIARERKPTP